jgi:hypothetical protein
MQGQIFINLKTELTGLPQDKDFVLESCTRACSSGISTISGASRTRSVSFDERRRKIRMADRARLEPVDMDALRCHGGVEGRGGSLTPLIIRDPAAIARARAVQKKKTPSRNGIGV